MGRIINAFFGDPLGSGTGQQPAWIPAADLEETDDAYTIELKLPGRHGESGSSSTW
jgi:HSP20 family molecular chaperone IbpA